MPDLEAEVWHFIAARVPDAFFRVHRVEAPIGSGLILNIVENEEFSFRPHEGLIGQAGADQVLFRLDCNSAGIATVGLQRAGFSDGAGQ